MISGGLPEAPQMCVRAQVKAGKETKLTCLIEMYMACAANGTGFLSTLMGSPSLPRLATSNAAHTLPSNGPSPTLTRLIRTDTDTTF